MNGISVTNLRIDAFFKKEKITIDLIHWLANELKKTSNVEEFFWVDMSSSNERLQSIDKISQNEKEIYLTTLNEGVSYNLRSHDCSNSLTRDHDQLSIHLDLEILQIGKDLNLLIAFFKQLVIEVKPDFAYCCFPSESDFAYGENNKGISAGIRDIYWLNYYGRSWIDIVDKEMLINLKACSFEEIKNTGFIVALDKPRSITEQKEDIKKAIGEKYFVDVDRKNKFGSSGLFKLMKKYFS